MTDTTAPLTQRFLQIGKLEGYSYLALLLIAMPLKYLADMPLAVGIRIAGSVHGVLFVAFVSNYFDDVAQEITNYRKC